MARLRGGQAVARALKAEGIDTVFGIVGTHNSLIFDGLTDLADLRVVTTRHEGGAGFMADGFARATGRPAACIVVPGPGLTNVMTALGQAYLDSVPVLAIAGQNPIPTLGRRLEEFHELHNSLQVAGSVTASARLLANPADAPGVIRDAVRLMRSGHPRPTYVEVPLDVAAAEADVEMLPPVEDFPRAGGDPDAIKRAAEVLHAARKPIILVGGGVIAAEASAALLSVASKLAAPIIMAGHGRGAVPDDHPLSLGDGWGRLTYFDDLFAEADATLIVGTSLDSVTDALRGEKLPAPVVQIDIDPEAIGRHKAAAVGIVGDARLVLERLTDALGGPGTTSPWCDVGAVRAKKRAELVEKAGPVLELLEAIRAVLPRDAIVADDLCLPGYWAIVALDVYEPRTFMHPGMFGTLGYALPAAIGASIGRPDRKAVALCGDGGFLYTSQELATAVQEQADVVAIVFNDNAYGALKIFQDRHHGGRRIGVELKNPDFAKLGEAYGAHGIKLRASADLGSALADALGRPGPAVIECPLDFDLTRVLPPWMP
jgi:thiamine pyrophosphate-dependent acetolactate synthase large subunit-like protein